MDRLQSIYNSISGGNMITPIKHVKQYMFELYDNTDMTQQQKDEFNGMLNMIYLYLKDKNQEKALQAASRCMTYVKNISS